MVVYVRQFKGFAFSHQEWQVEYENLKNVLSDETQETFDQDVWYHIGYNSPFICTIMIRSYIIDAF